MIEIDGIKYDREYCTTQAQKYEIGEFIYDNTETFILNTFMYLWESRGWWTKHPIDTARDKNGKLVGIKINAAKPEENLLKSYYSVIRRDYREKHIFSKILLQSLYGHDDCEYITVTCTAGRDGEKFYGNMFKNVPECKIERRMSEFGIEDVIYTVKLKTMIELLEKRCNKN